MVKYIYHLPFVEKHIIIGAEEGVYSLNFSENLHEAEMEQVIMSIHHTWLYVMKLKKCIFFLTNRIVDNFNKEVIQYISIGRDCVINAPTVLCMNCGPISYK